MRVSLWRTWLAGLLLALLALAGCGAAGPNQWQNVGPSGAQITALAADPHIHGIIYAGANDGSTYLARGDHSGVFAPSTTSPGQGQVNVLFPNPGADGVVYAGTAGGFYSSSDYGQRYAARNSGLPSGADVTAVTTLADTTTIVISVTQKGFYVSSDGGKSWKAVPAGAGALPAKATVQALLWDDAAQALYAAVSDVAAGVYVSHDAGATWSNASDGLPANTNVYALAMAPASGTASSAPTLYAGTSSGAYARAGAAATWQARGTGLPAGTVYALATYPPTPDTLYAGVGQTVYGTSNGGQQWRKIANDLEHAAVAIVVTPGQHAPTVAFVAAGQVARYPGQPGGGDSTVEGTIIAAIVIGLVAWYVLGHYHIVPSMADVRRRITQRR